MQLTHINIDVEAQQWFFGDRKGLAFKRYGYIIPSVWSAFTIIKIAASQFV